MRRVFYCPRPLDCKTILSALGGAIARPATYALPALQSRPMGRNARPLAPCARPPLLAYARARACVRAPARARAYSLIITILF